MKGCDDCEWNRIRIETLEVALKLLATEVEGLHNMLTLADQSEEDERK